MLTNVAIIGGSTGLGAKITEHVIEYMDPFPLVIGRGQGHTIATEDGRHSISLVLKNSHKDLKYIFINAFDHAEPDAQEKMFRTLWDMYKNTDVTFVVIGSTAKMWGWNAANPMAKGYSKAKKNLYEAVFYSTWEDTTTAKSILIEPSFVQNVVDYFEDKGQLYLSYEEFIGILEAGLQMSLYLKLTCIIGKGLHPASKFKNR